MIMTPVINFKNDFLDGDEHEMKLRGYRNDVIVLLPDGKAYELSFFNPSRIAQEVGQVGYVIEKNLIVIEDITIGKIKDVVNKMWNDGFFSDVSPFQE